MQPNTNDVIFNKLTLSTLDGNRSVDLTLLMLEMNIIEDIFKGYIYGDITITDEINLYNGLPVLCEEVLNVSFSTTVSTEVRAYKFFCYNICNMMIDRESKYQVYTLKFISFDQYTTSKSINSFNVSGLISDNIKKLLITTNVVNPVEYIQPTTVNVNYTLPLNTVFDNIKYLKTKAYTNIKGDSNVWVFYETSKGYTFQTISNMITRGIKKKASLEASDISTTINIGTYSHLPLSTSKVYLRASSSSAIGSRDTLSGLREGHYNSNMLAYDLTTRSLQNYSDNYQNSFGSFTHTDSNNLQPYPNQSQYFQNNVISNTPYTHFNVGDSTKPDFNINTSTFNSRNMYTQTLSEYNLTVTVPGDTHIYAGDILNVDLPERSPYTVTLDLFKSGNYLVGSQTHNFKGTVAYNMVLVLFKDCAVGNIETQMETQSVSL